MVMSGKGKYGSELAEILYGQDPDESTGDSCEYGWWYGLFLIGAPETVTDATRGEITLSPGCHVICESPDGFVDVVTYVCAQDAQDAFDRYRDAYDAWADMGEYREYAITSSTGRIGR